MEKSKVAIIVPIYNVEQYISECVESLLNQTMSEIQIILVDDGSTDSSGKMVDTFTRADDRIIPIHKKNGGISSARNEGLKHVNAEYFTFLDSDDWVDKDMYLRMYTAACNTCADVVSSDINCSEVQKIDTDIIGEYLKRGDVSCCNKLFKVNEDVFKSFSFDQNNVSIDIKGCYDLFKYCKIWTVIPGAYYYYRQDNLSYGRSGFSERDLNCVILTKMVAADVQQNYPQFINYAHNHCIHAKLDILSKTVLYGFKTHKDEEVFQTIKKAYIHDIRKNLFKSMKTPYFSRNEKIQMLFVSISFSLFSIMKKVYIKTRKQKESCGFQKI